MKKNIISLVGMTGCGKSTVSKIVASKLYADLIDLDDYIVQKEGNKIVDIFEKYGEEAFRQKENMYLERIVEEFKDSNRLLVLSLGGGIMTNPKNIPILSNYTFVVWIKRTVEDVVKNENVLSRPPINNNPDKYLEIYKKRAYAYSKYSNAKIYNFVPKKTAKKVINKYTCYLIEKE